VDWRAVADVAGTQHGVVSREQLREMGVDDAAVDRAIARARLFPVFRGVFAVGHTGAGRDGRLLAATLACGAGSTISHGTAAALLGLWERFPAQIDVVAPIESGRKIDGIRRRHTRPAADADRLSVRAIPCSGPSQAIVEVAGIVGEASLRRTIEQAAVLDLLDVRRIESIIAGRRRRGTPKLRAVLEGWREYTPGTRLRSPMEAKLLPLLALRDIPQPECNVELRAGGETFEIDFFWRDRKVIVETDGAKFHDNPEAEARDRRRDYLLSAAGYRVHRLRWYDLDERPEATMHELVGLLRLNRSK